MKKIIYYGAIVCGLAFYIKMSIDEEREMRKIESREELQIQAHDKSKYTDCLYYSSHMGILPILYGIYRGKPEVALPVGITFLTSLNYWRKPRYTWRRTIDVHMSRFTVLYNIYYAAYLHGATIHYMYIPLMSSCIALYPIGIYNYSKHRYWHFVLAHMGVHLSAALATILSCDA